MLGLKEERQWQQLKKLGLKLRVPIPEVFLGLEVKDGKGQVIHKHEQRSHTWNRNAYNWLLSQFGAINADGASWGAGNINMKDVGATLRTGAYPIAVDPTESAEAGNKGYMGAAANDEFGIVVGSGVGAESFEDWVLGTQIEEGAVAGKLNHILSETPVDTYTAGTKTWTVVFIRYFNNNSGGNVDVNEVAIYGKVSAANTVLGKMPTRDKLASTVTVPDTGQLKVTYTIQLVFPE
jgi:outer membrane biogenesis lipoprotein LolB